ncbi:MAG: paraquat-inducible protein A [Rhodospirillales bacterium]|nr:paraquat-inducible protein A [Rhodospirillales bacterium]
MTKIKENAAGRWQFWRKVAGSLADVGGWQTHFVGLLLVIASGMFAAGITLPLFKVTKVYLFEDDVSVLLGIELLVRDNEFFLALVIVAFSILAPILKIGLVYRVWRRVPAGSKSFARWLQRVELVTRWSMLEVLVVAVIVMAAKAGSLSNAQTQDGLYFFVGSWVMVTASIQLLKHEARKVGALPGRAD